MQKITPFLWFDREAEQAANFYVSVFRDAGIDKITHYDEPTASSSGQPAGSVMTVAFHLFGQDFVALNGGQGFSFNEAISFVVNCDTQQEIDALWDKLGAGGAPIQCGWIRDRYGVFWQIIPSSLGELVSGPDPVRAQRANAALMQMVKIDLAQLRRAYDEG